MRLSASLKGMQSRWLIGLSSGTTVDGVDAALVEGVGTGLDLRLRLRHSLHQPYGRDLREILWRLTGDTAAPFKQITQLHRLLGETFAAAARHVADQASLSLARVQCVGCAGHPLWHETEGRCPSSLELGMAAVVAERTGVTTISDFRARDLSVGGHGAPLTALVDYLLFHDPSESRVLLHLGGVANAVWLPAQSAPYQVVGFQAGPCNLLLDGLMRRLTHGREALDAGGKHAVQGCCIEPLVERWLAHPGLNRRPPRGLPPDGFAEEFILQALQQVQHLRCSLHDLLCTATHLVARCIVQAVRRYLPQPAARILLSGGGVRNGFLWHLLEQQLDGIPMERVDQHGVPVTARKALAFAGLAALTVDGIPGNVMSVTGAAGTRLLGAITPGSTANWARCLAWMSSQTVPAASLPAFPLAESA